MLTNVKTYTEWKSQPFIGRNTTSFRLFAELLLLSMFRLAMSLLLLLLLLSTTSTLSTLVSSTTVCPVPVSLAEEVKEEERRSGEALAPPPIPPHPVTPLQELVSDPDPPA